MNARPGVISGSPSFGGSAKRVRTTRTRRVSASLRLCVNPGSNEHLARGEKRREAQRAEAGWRQRAVEQSFPRQSHEAFSPTPPRVVDDCPAPIRIVLEKVNDFRASIFGGWQPPWPLAPIRLSGSVQRYIRHQPVPIRLGGEGGVFLHRFPYPFPATLPPSLTSLTVTCWATKDPF